MTHSALSSFRTVLTTLFIWLMASAVIAGLNLPLWGAVTVAVVALIFNVGVWKWQQVRLLLDSDHLHERLQALSDAELQTALEDVAAFKATLVESGKYTSGMVRHLIETLNKNQLLLMKERLQRMGFYEDILPAMSGVSPMVHNYSSKYDR